MTNEFTAKAYRHRQAPRRQTPVAVSSPRLPAFGRLAVGSSVRAGGFRFLSNSADQRAQQQGQQRGSRRSARARSSELGRDKVWNTRAGVVTEVTSVVMNAPPRDIALAPEHPDARRTARQHQHDESER